MKWLAGFTMLAVLGAIHGLPTLGVLGSPSHGSHESSSTLDLGVGVGFKDGDLVLQEEDSRAAHSNQYNQQVTEEKTADYGHGENGQSYSHETDSERQRSQQEESNQSEHNTRQIALGGGGLHTKQTKNKSGDLTKTDEEYNHSRSRTQENGKTNTGEYGRTEDTENESGSKTQSQTAYNEEQSSNMDLGLAGLTHSNSGSKTTENRNARTGFDRSRHFEDEYSRNDAATAHRSTNTATNEENEDSEDSQTHREYKNQAQGQNNVGKGQQGYAPGDLLNHGGLQSGTGQYDVKKVLGSLAAQVPIHHGKNIPIQINHVPKRKPSGTIVSSENASYRDEYENYDTKYGNHRSKPGSYSENRGTHGASRGYNENRGTGTREYVNEDLNHAYNNNHHLSGTGYWDTNTGEYQNRDLLEPSHAYTAHYATENQKATDYRNNIQNHEIGISKYITGPVYQDTDTSHYMHGAHAPSSVSYVSGTEDQATNSENFINGIPAHGADIVNYSTEYQGTNYHEEIKRILDQLHNLVRNVHRPEYSRSIPSGYGIVPAQVIIPGSSIGANNEEYRYSDTAFVHQIPVGRVAAPGSNIISSGNAPGNHGTSPIHFENDYDRISSPTISNTSPGNGDTPGHIDSPVNNHNGTGFPESVINAIYGTSPGIHGIGSDYYGKGPGAGSGYYSNSDHETEPGPKTIIGTGQKDNSGAVTVFTDGSLIIGNDVGNKVSGAKNTDNKNIDAAAFIIDKSLVIKNGGTGLPEGNDYGKKNKTTVLKAKNNIGVSDTNDNKTNKDATATGSFASKNTISTGNNDDVTNATIAGNKQVLVIKNTNTDGNDVGKKDASSIINNNDDFSGRDDDANNEHATAGGTKKDLVSMTTDSTGSLDKNYEATTKALNNKDTSTTNTNGTENSDEQKDASSIIRDKVASKNIDNDGNSDSDNDGINKYVTAAVYKNGLTAKTTNGTDGSDKNYVGTAETTIAVNDNDTTTKNKNDNDKQKDVSSIISDKVSRSKSTDITVLIDKNDRGTDKRKTSASSDNATTRKNIDKNSDSGRNDDGNNKHDTTAVTQNILTSKTTDGTGSTDENNEVTALRITTVNYKDTTSKNTNIDANDDGKKDSTTTDMYGSEDSNGTGPKDCTDGGAKKYQNLAIIDKQLSSANTSGYDNGTQTTDGSGSTDGKGNTDKNDGQTNKDAKSAFIVTSPNSKNDSAYNSSDTEILINTLGNRGKNNTDSGGKDAQKKALVDIHITGNSYNDSNTTHLTKANTSDRPGTNKSTGDKTRSNNGLASGNSTGPDSAGESDGSNVDTESSNCDHDSNNSGSTSLGSLTPSNSKSGENNSSNGKLSHDDNSDSSDNNSNTNNSDNINSDGTSRSSGSPIRKDSSGQTAISDQDVSANESKKKSGSTTVHKKNSKESKTAADSNNGLAAANSTGPDGTRKSDGSNVDTESSNCDHDSSNLNSSKSPDRSTPSNSNFGENNTANGSSSDQVTEDDNSNSSDNNSNINNRDNINSDGTSHSNNSSIQKESSKQTSNSDQDESADESESKSGPTTVYKKNSNESETAAEGESSSYEQKTKDGNGKTLQSGTKNASNEKSKHKSDHYTEIKNDDGSTKSKLKSSNMAESNKALSSSGKFKKVDNYGNTEETQVSSDKTSHSTHNSTLSVEKPKS